MFLDQPLHRRVRVLPARVLVAVSRDDEHGLRRARFIRQVLLNLLDELHGYAHGIEQRCASPYLVVVFREQRHLFDGNAVAQHLGLVIEQHYGHHSIARSLTVLFQHRIHAANRVGFHACHRTAAVYDEYQLGEFLVHDSPFVSPAC